LHRQGWTVNPKRVRRLLRVLCIRKRKFVVTTNSNHGCKICPNLAGKVTPTGVDQLWVADITYVRLQEKFIFLAVMLDAHSRRVIGWALDRTMEDELTLAALRMALTQQSIRPGRVHHSDRGSRYASNDYTDLLKGHGIDISMSRKGNPWDKAYASFCTSCEPWKTISGKRRRLASLRPGPCTVDWVQDPHTTNMGPAARPRRPPARPASPRHWPSRSN
jgi:transposase InsO family protein